MQTFKQNILNLNGERGEAWLSNLDNLVNSFAKAHGLSGLEPVNNLSYNYVLAGLKGDRPIILKLSADAKALKQEASLISKIY